MSRLLRHMQPLTETTTLNDMEIYQTHKNKYDRPEALIVVTVAEKCLCASIYDSTIDGWTEEDID